MRTSVHKFACIVPFVVQISLDCATKHIDPDKYFNVSFFYSVGKEVAPSSVVLCR